MDVDVSWAFDPPEANGFRSFNKLLDLKVAWLTTWCNGWVWREKRLQEGKVSNKGAWGQLIRRL